MSEVTQTAADISLRVLRGDKAALAIVVLRRFESGEGPFTPGDAGRMAVDIEALERRALEAEGLLATMMKASTMGMEALGVAYETLGYLDACMFGAEHHLRAHGWLKPAPTLQSEERPF